MSARPADRSAYWWGVVDASCVWGIVALALMFIGAAIGARG